MARSTKTNKARQLNAAFAMLRRNTPLPETMQRLAREFDLSERQAYRYLAEATHLKRPVEVCEDTVPITLKVPAGTARLLRAYARTSGLTIGAIVTRALTAFLSTQNAWLSRGQRPARFKFTLSICLIVCTNRNSSRHTVFLCPFGNVPLAAV
jgi:hypothetical protein